jgi:putative NIF3 family GTP cyclohydrolase 1 type 2
VTFEDPIDIEELVQRVKKHLSLSQGSPAYLPPGCLSRTTDYNERTVDVGRPLAEKPITSVAICAGAGGTMLSGVDADVYFTGEMQHVGLALFVCTFLTIIPARNSWRRRNGSIRHPM